MTLADLEQGYCPDSTESVLIFYTDNIEAGIIFGAHHGFNVCMSARYLGVFIGDDASKREWLIDQMEVWERNIITIRKHAVKYP